MPSIRFILGDIEIDKLRGLGVFDKIFTKRAKLKERMQQTIAEKIQHGTVCYVLITCQEADEEGNMKVELSYEGDGDLASYLISSAYHQGRGGLCP